MEEMLIEKVHHRTLLCDTKSPDYRDQHMRANAWEGIGKELKIKCKFYVSSRDLGLVCPRLKLTYLNLAADGQHLLASDNASRRRVNDKRRQKLKSARAYTEMTVGSH
jgi:hypothetical protein